MYSCKDARSVAILNSIPGIVQTSFSPCKIVFELRVLLYPVSVKKSSTSLRIIRQWKSNKYCRYESEKIAWTVCQKLLQCWKAFQASCEPFSLSLSLSLSLFYLPPTTRLFIPISFSIYLTIFPCNPLLSPCVVTNAHGPSPQPTAC